MARITPYERGVALQPTNTPAPELSSAFAQELERFGGSIQDVAAAVEEQTQKRENFTAENAYRRLKQELQADLENRAQEITPGGAGFHESYIAEVYRPKRDAFLAGLPERLKPQFEAILNDETGADTNAWEIASATVERDEGYRWQKEEIGAAQEELATSIGMNGDEAYDGLLAEGQRLIEVSSLPTPERARLTQEWERMAQVARLNSMLADDPEGVIRELGGDPRKLSPTTQFAMLSRAVQWQESRDNPNAVSGKGAVGLMQVMPDTAAEIAVELGDTAFPKGAPEGAIRAYLSNPYVSKMYGEHYLKKQLRAFANTRNPIETALVAYNAGPGVAQKWVESGYNDKVLSAETRKYKKAIMADLTSPVAKGAAADVKFAGADTSKTNPDLVGRVADAYATLGLKNVKVNSAERSAAKNKAVGGADKSQHLDANALDLDVSGMTIPQKIELIKSLSASGVTGIGVYGNTIHADLGGRRAWGPDHSAASVPKWASSVVSEHLAGTTPPPRAVSTRYASLPYDTAQDFLAKADQEVARQATAAAKSSAVEKVEIKQRMDNEIALIRATGAGSGQLDETAIATILGEDDYLTYTAKKDVAQRTFTATEGIATMAPEDMEQRFNDYAPIPGSDDFAAQQQIQAAVQKEVDRVQNLRARNPDQAALEYPDVQQAYQQIASMDASGQAVPPNQVQAFVRLMLEKQASFDVPEKARAPIPAEWALQVGRVIGNIPRVDGRNMEEVKAELIQTYSWLQSIYGDYADDVLAYSIAEYKGIDKDQAERIGNLIPALVKGTLRLRADIDAINDQNAVEGFSWDSEPLVRGFKRVFNMPIDPRFAPQDEGLSPEEQLRLQQTEEE